MSATADPLRPAATARRRASLPVPAVIGALGVLLAGGVVMLVFRAEARINKVSLADAPKPVTVVTARAASYRPARSYVGTFEPWVSASVGPQLVSAYVETVLVRPGAVVRKGEVLATLDCRTTTAASAAISAEARAIEAQQRAQANEAARYKGMLDGGFASPNEVEMKTATSTSEQAKLQATRAQLVGSSLEVSDCVLRAPFDGEVASRSIDPGAFVRPGVALVSVVDRGTVRFTVDVPESDFEAVAPGTELRIRLLSTGRRVTARVSRRSPSADPSTRTIRIEVDIADPTREIPVGTTGEAELDVGQPVAATELPLAAASINNGKATVFVVDAGVARSRTFAVKGEAGGSVFFDPALPAGSRVVLEGRALLRDGDPVTPTDAPAPDRPPPGAAPPARAAEGGAR
jgi:RND family efflux transporter MFP subunit